MMGRLALLVLLFVLPTPAKADGKIPVPDLMGQTEQQARTIARAAGFLADIEVNRIALVCKNAAKDEGRVTCQNPDPGTLVERYHRIQVSVYHAPTHPGRILREQLATLVGMTVEQAKAALEKLGHVGTVDVLTELQFVKRCGLDKVCHVDPEGGVDVQGDIRLFINPKATISAPPPD